jgi:hypothetical protein
MHGVELVRAVIERLEQSGMDFINHPSAPQPLPAEVLRDLRLPNGEPLSPSLACFLAFDAGFLSLLREDTPPTFKAASIGELARTVYGDHPSAAKFAVLEKTLPGLCLLLPMGKESKRILYLGQPDSVGEFPVLVLDPEDPPFVCVEYPGIDVFLADRARFLPQRSREFGGLGSDEVYGPRMQEHRDKLFGGLPSLRYGDDGFAPLIESDLDVSATRMLGPGEPIPEGYRLVEEVENPMFGMTMRLVAPIK